MLSFERARIKLQPLTMVLATSNAKIDILLPFVVVLDPKPLIFKFVMLLPSVSSTSTAFPRLTVPALPIIELTSDTCFNMARKKMKHDTESGALSHQATFFEHSKNIGHQ
jgi:hypothetical protein